MHYLPIGMIMAAMLVGCGRATESDSAEVQTALEKVRAETAEAENAGDAQRMRVHFTDDIVMMGPNIPEVVGADKVVASMSGFFEGFTLHMEYTGQEIAVMGDWAFDRGTFRSTVTPKNGGASVSENGKYFWLYRRQPDGSWKQSRVMWNSSERPK
jgi:uncharacterized protein (TIGR02246 family)